ncbi:gas vesicle protein [Actinomadura decatromicini]|uniref:Gas vesicle protein n=1 Tax=Actinomadura decatromicini TaxID=2604572 RepID=A0A5D3F9X0_9ACTN|nr:gas vesicle protein [Actinomadura decatromicini]TYK45003.1 gas vesicle protein [Actinomadura decatromicini]
MSDIPWTGTPSTARSTAMDTRAGGQPANLADLLERILDKGIVIVGDIRVNLLDIELLTIKLRLLVASVDKAKEMGIDWWEHDPSLSSKARRDENGANGVGGTEAAELAEENRRLRERLAALESAAASPPDGRPRLEPAHAEPQQARDGQAPDERDPDGQARDEPAREEQAPRSEPRAREKEQRS